jgi:hypothetical protein
VRSRRSIRNQTWNARNWSKRSTRQCRCNVSTHAHTTHTERVECACRQVVEDRCDLQRTHSALHHQVRHDIQVAALLIGRLSAESLCVRNSELRRTYDHNMESSAISTRCLDQPTAVHTSACAFVTSDHCKIACRTTHRIDTCSKHKPSRRQKTNSRAWLSLPQERIDIGVRRHPRHCECLFLI